MSNRVLEPMDVTDASAAIKDFVSFYESLSPEQIENYDTINRHVYARLIYIDSILCHFSTEISPKLVMLADLLQVPYASKDADQMIEMMGEVAQHNPPLGEPESINANLLALDLTDVIICTIIDGVIARQKGEAGLES